MVCGGGEGERVGQRLVELEQVRIDLQRTGKPRKAVFDRNELPKLILPLLRFRLGAADDGRKTGRITTESPGRP